MEQWLPAAASLRMIAPTIPDHPRGARIPVHAANEGVANGHTLQLGPGGDGSFFVDDEALVRTLLSDAMRGARFEVATTANEADARKVVDDFDSDVAVVNIHPGSGPSGLHLVTPCIGVTRTSGWCS